MCAVKEVEESRWPPLVGAAQGLPKKELRPCLFFLSLYIEKKDSSKKGKENAVHISEMPDNPMSVNFFLTRRISLKSISYRYFPSIFYCIVLTDVKENFVM